MTGDRYFPTFVGSETQVRAMLVDYGPTWARPSAPGEPIGGAHSHYLQSAIAIAVHDPGAVVGPKGDGRTLWGWIVDAVMATLIHRGQG